MAITYNDSSGKAKKVESVVFNGKEVKQLKYDSGDGQQHLVWCKPYTLSVPLGIGVGSVTVTRTSSQEPSANNGTLSNGSTIYYGDTLKVSATAQSGYTLNSYTSTYTVVGNLTIDISARLTTYIVSIGKGTGVASVTVTRTSSPYQQAFTGELTDGAAIYYGDELTVDATPSTGYSLSSYTKSYTVRGSVDVLVNAYVQNFILTIKKGTGVDKLTVKRTSSPLQNAALTSLTNGSVIYYGDKLSVVATAATGFEMNGYTGSYTVQGNLTINVTAFVPSYTLTITKDAGVKSVTVQRISSPYQGADLVTLNNGATIYLKDTLRVSAEEYSDYYILEDYTSYFSVSGNINVNITTKEKSPLMNAAKISGSMEYNSSTGKYSATVSIYNYNHLDVEAEYEIEDGNGTLLKSDTVSISEMDMLNVSVTDVSTSKVRAHVMLRHSLYRTMPSSGYVEFSKDSTGSKPGES